MVGLMAVSGLYLGTYHPSDVVAAIVLVLAIMVNAFRYFTPNDAFPLERRKGKTAHLDVGGRRGDAIRQAVLPRRNTSPSLDS